MKKIVLPFALMLILSSCYKKADFCGTVVEKYASGGKFNGLNNLHLFIVVEKNSQLFVKEVGTIEYDNTNLYSTYCGDL